MMIVNMNAKVIVKQTKEALKALAKTKEIG